MKKRIFSFLTALALCLTLLPISALAAGVATNAFEVVKPQTGDSAVDTAGGGNHHGGERPNVMAQLKAIDGTKLALTDEERDELDFIRYQAAAAVLAEEKDNPHLVNSTGEDMTADITVLTGITMYFDLSQYAENPSQKDCKVIECPTGWSTRIWSGKLGIQPSNVTTSTQGTVKVTIAEKNTTTSLSVSDAAVTLPVTITFNVTAKPFVDANNSNVYNIPDYETLCAFAEAVDPNNTFKNKTVKLTADITANNDLLNTDGTLNTTNTDSLKKWKPIGKSGALFFGTFDGQNHTISGLYFDDPTASYVGLFGYIRNAMVKDVGVKDSYFSAKNYVGGVVGYADYYQPNSSTITGCHSKNVTIRSTAGYSGGVCGYAKNGSTISDCYNTGVVSNTGSGIYVGGVCGGIYQGTITNCHNTGKVTSQGGSVGGICGNIQNDCSVTNCYNTGEISGGSNIGGICGYSFVPTQNMSANSIENCHNTGKVTGSAQYIGGICGHIGSSSDNAATTVTDCYNTGEISGTSFVGGICGDTLYSITNCHNEGTVAGQNTKVGGICGESEGPITSCYNTGAVSANAELGGICGDANSGAPVKECYNTGTVTGRNINIGGVVGNSSDAITSCYNTGVVSSSSDYVGGVCGNNYGGTMSNSYNTGAVKGSKVVGGVCGRNGGTITDCYYRTGCATDGNSTLQNGIGSLYSGSTTADVEGQTITKGEDSFQGGEVAYLLQGEQSPQMWGQALSGTVDASPVLSDDTAKKVYKVTFMNGSEEYTARYANSGGKVKLPDMPANEQYELTKWSQTSSTSGTEFTNNTIVTSDMTVYAVWQEKYGEAEGDKTVITTYGTEVTQDLSAYMAYGGTTTTVDKFTYEIKSENDNEYFSIDDDKLKVPSTTPAGTYSLTITATEKTPQISMRAANAISYGTTPVTLNVTVMVNKADQEAPDVTINYTVETLSTTTAMEWSTDGSTWTSCTDTMNVSDCDWDGSAKTVQFRTAAGDSNHNPSPAIELSIPARPDAPAKAVKLTKTNDSIKVTNTDDFEGSEFSVDDTDWNTTGIFENLEANHDYALQVRVKATSNSFRSDTMTQHVTTTAADGSTILKPGETVETEDGTTITNHGDTVTTETGNTTTTITSPSSGNVDVGGDGSVEVPAGSTVQTGEGPQITTGSDGSTVGGDGSVTVPGGSSVTIPDGEGGETTITVPEDVGTITLTDGGKVEVPGGSTVQTGEGPQITTGDEGATVSGDGSVTVPGGSSVTIPDGEGGETTITVPEGGEGTITPTEGGKVEVPGGSTVQTGDDPQITTGNEGATVGGDGSVTVPGGSSVTIPDGKGGETTITVPEGGEGTVTPIEEGNVEVPGGSTVQTGDGPEITLPDGGTIDQTGTVTTEPGGSVEVGGVTITPPSGETVTVDQDGTATVPPGSTVTEGGTTVTLPDSDTVESDGSIIVPPGGKVTITTEDGETVTITVPEDGGKVQIDEDGNITVPGGSTVQTGDDTPVTIPSTGGSVSTGGEIKYDVTVTFEPQNDTPATSQTIPVGGKATKPSDPIRSGYTFDGWYTDAAGTTAWDFDTAVTGSMTLYAKWTVKPSGTTPEPIPVSQRFVDVPTGAWFEETVQYVVDHGLFYGTSDTTFSPESDMTRGMVATVLYRLAKEPGTGVDHLFNDVADGKYYTEAIAWAAETGVVTGYGNNCFGPEDPITREQLATILWRYAGSPAGTGTLEGFSDSNKASAYAMDALRWAVDAGILNGRGNGILDPTGKATRAEVATMLTRYCKAFTE